MATNPRNFTLNTDYEMDKIVCFFEGSLGPGQERSINHDLGFIPLIFGVCAYNSDFSDARTLPYNATTERRGFLNASARQNLVHIGYYDYGAESLAKMYYRIYGFEPPGSSTTIASTSNRAEKFVINTDYNYLKIFKAGSVSTTPSSIQHGLGYIPQTLFWGEWLDFDGTPYVVPIPNSYWGSYDGAQSAAGISVTPTEINFNPVQPIVPQVLSKIHYRIYYDEA